MADSAKVEGGRREHGVEDLALGGGEGKKGKKNGWVCGASDSKWPAAASEGGGGLASLGGWAQWATVALAGARRWGEDLASFR